MSCFAPVAPLPPHDVAFRRRAFGLVELLVALAVVLTLASIVLSTVSVAGGIERRNRTRALIAKIDSIVAPQYASYASRNVDSADRGATLREIARNDLPDDWSVVSALAAKPESALTAHQLVYVAVWNSLGAQAAVVDDFHGSAECLFLAVMLGGLADCLDCDSLHIDVGDKDNDGMPEFLDAWNNPIGFIEAPARLQFRGQNFFSSTLPFEPVVVTSLEAKGGLMRPLIVSSGPDGVFGLEADAGPTPGSVANRDNLTNFDEEARR